FCRSQACTVATFDQSRFDELVHAAANASRQFESAREESDTSTLGQRLVLGNLLPSGLLSYCQGLRGGFSEVRRGKRIENGEIRRQNSPANHRTAGVPAQFPFVDRLFIAVKQRCHMDVLGLNFGKS